MPKGKDEQPTQEQINFALEFAKVLNQYNSYLFNPFMQNNALKDINMRPADQSRDNILKMIANPRDNEQALRRLSQFLYNTQMAYKRMTHYLADILTFDWYPIPINANEDDYKKPSFKKDYETACGWFDKFDVKKEFKKALLKMVEEDAYFTYMREDTDSLFLQEMPIDYCMIDSSWKYGYLYSFNLMYFQQTGVDISGFSKEFKTYYKNALDMKENKTYYSNIKPEMRNGQWCYWQQINPENGWVFKFHNHFAGLVPPFLGVFLDFADIPMIKELQKAKSEQEAYKIIFGTVPRNNNDKSGNSKDNFAIQADTLAQFVQLVKNSIMNKYVDFKAVPLDNLQMFSFDEKTNKEDSLSKALNNISSQTGIDHALLNTEKANVATMNLSKLVDGEFISRIYSQFQDFCTYFVNKETKKFKFKICFEGTIYDRDERQERALTLAQNGIITPKLASAEGMSIKDLTSGMALMKMLGFPDNLKPVQTSSTLSNKEQKGGRPKSKIKTESGEVTETAGSNLEKEVDD